MDFDYKKYSLERLEEWMHDAMSAGEASPQEIYDVIIGVVKENYYTYKQQASQAYELLALLNGNGQSYEDVLKERNYYEGCDKDDPSEECKKSWTSFWEENYYPEEYKGSTVSSVQYTEEELNAMCDKAASDQEKEKCREYNLREAEYYDKRAKLDMNSSYDDMIAAGYTMTADGFWIPPQEEDKVVKWQLPVQVDGLSGDCYVEFPDDLLERAGLVEGDTVKWIDRNDGSFELRKVTKPLGMDEC